MSLKQWAVYLLKCSDETLYCGVTNNIDRRIREHNTSKRGAKYTRSRRPVCLIGSISASSRSEAQKLESKIKKMKRVDKLAFFK
jgi:putative endonuclease